MANGERIYWRDQGGSKRAYADLRDLGGGREAIKADGERRALKWDSDLNERQNTDLARKLLEPRLKELEEGRKAENQGRKLKRSWGLAKYAERHLTEKAKEGQVSTRWLQEVQRHLEVAVQHFGRERLLSSIDPDDCSQWVAALQEERGVSKATARKYLTSLGDMFARAVSERKVAAEVNPVASMYTRPTPEKPDPDWFTPAEAALILESARTFEPEGLRSQEHGGAISAGSYPYIYPLVAFWLLTGARKSEALGMEVDDVSFKHSTVTIRPNGWRGLKTTSSERTIPLWPQLEEILREHLIRLEQEGGAQRLLFPATRPPKKKDDGDEEVPQPRERMLDNVRKVLDRIGARASFEPGTLRSTAFRHTYATTRLYTLDAGSPVPVWTVSAELGHSSTAMVEEVYGHILTRRNEAWAKSQRERQDLRRKVDRLLLEARKDPTKVDEAQNLLHRLDELEGRAFQRGVEYQIEDHRDILKDRLSKLAM